MRRVLIFDGTNTFIRNFVVNPTSDTNGTPVGGLFGTIRSVKWAIQEFKPHRVIFVWDGTGGAQRRRGVVSEYKMGRKPRLNREVDEKTGDSKANMDWQRQKLKQLLPFLGIVQIEIDNIEADDTIGYLVGLLEPDHKYIVSSDRDMWQLVSPTTSVYWPTKKVMITPDTFKDQSPYHHSNFVLARAISGKGDTSDNIHGIEGLGDKTIMKLFPELATRPDCSLEYILGECRAILEQQGPEPKGKFRWYKAILDNAELVSRNVEVMQLTSPNISAQAASVIREQAEKTPTFNLTGFKLALLNNNLQVTDNDIFTAFTEYKQRASSG